MRSKRKPKQSELWGRNHLIGMVVVAALVLVGIFYMALRAKPLRQEDATAGPIPIYFRSAADAMPFPATLDPLKFQRRDIREAYQVAKEIPEVLAQQPCYCYCERKGHRGLLDCFRTEHAASCDICIKEALLARTDAPIGEIDRGDPEGDHSRSVGRRREFKPMIVTRAVQLQLNQKGEY
jgi:hypothetical protein